MKVVTLQWQKLHPFTFHSAVYFPFWSFLYRPQPRLRPTYCFYSCILWRG